MLSIDIDPNQLQVIESKADAMLNRPITNIINVVINIAVYTSILRIP